MRKSARSVIVSALMLTAFVPSAYAEWSEARSRNFIFVGEVSQKRALKTVQDLEIFRTSVFRIFGWTYTPEPIPIRVHGARSSRDIRTIMGLPRIGGAYTRDAEGPTFVLDMSSGRANSDTRIVAFHEFTHHLTNTYSNRRFPTWYNEGYADYLSTFKIQEAHGTSLTRVIIGEPSTARGLGIAVGHAYDWDKFIAAVRGYPFELDGRSSEIGGFYAQGWLAAHYIQSTPGYPEKLDAYLSLLNAPDAPEDAFEQTFEMTPRAFGRVLDKYFKDERFPAKALTFDESFQIPQITTRKLTKAEAAYYEGEVIRTFHSSNREDEGEDNTETDDPVLSKGQKAAERHYAKSIEMGGSASQVYASRALMFMQAGDFTNAFSASEQAVELAPENNRTLHIASFIHYLHYTDEDTPRLESDLETARTYSLRAIHANPDNLGAHFIHALSFAEPGDAPSRQAVSSALDSSAYFTGDAYDTEKILLADLLIEGGKLEDARRILEDISAWSESADQRAHAHQILDDLDRPKTQTPGGASPSLTETAQAQAEN